MLVNSGVANGKSATNPTPQVRLLDQSRQGRTVVAQSSPKGLIQKERALLDGQHAPMVRHNHYNKLSMIEEEAENEDDDKPNAQKKADAQKIQ